MAERKGFEELTPDEKESFKGYLKVFMGYEDDIKSTREAQKEQISQCAGEIQNMSKKDIKKLFNYFKKKVNPDELREDAEEIEEIKEFMNN